MSQSQTETLSIKAQYKDPITSSCSENVTGGGPVDLYYSVAVTSIDLATIWAVFGAYQNLYASS